MCRVPTESIDQLIARASERSEKLAEHKARKERAGFMSSLGWLSWLPYAVSFDLLPAFLSYGGLGGGMHGAPPTLAMTVLAALLGIGIHFLNVLPDLVEDKETGVRHLPLRIALRIGAPKLLWISTGYTVLVAAGIVIAALTVGVRQ